jgi:cytochrome P450
MIPAATTPKLLQIAQWILDPIGYMANNSRRYGDLFHAPVWGQDPDRVFMVSDPKSIQFVLTHDTGKGFTSPGELNELLAPMLGRQNTILLSGEQHRQRRQLVLPPFHGEHLKEYGNIIQRITQEVIDEWAVGEEINVREVMQAITMRVILQVVFGLDHGDRYTRLARILAIRLGMTATPFTSIILFLPWLQTDLGPWSPGGRMARLAAETDDLLFAEIEERRAHPEGNRVDVLSLLLAARDAQGQGLSDQDLRDELMTLLVAGHETTATALTSAMYWVHRSDAVLQNLRSELDGLVDGFKLEALLRLPYLSAVCNEALRIHPVAMLTFPRQVKECVEICGYQLEPDDVVLGSIYLLHQNKDLYPNPQEFRPERFLERQFSPYEFMPFGAGVRRCVGAALAQYELKIVLGTLIRKHNLALLNTRPVGQARRGITLGHDAPVRIRSHGLRTRQPPIPVGAN